MPFKDTGITARDEGRCLLNAVNTGTVLCHVVTYTETFFDDGHYGFDGGEMRSYQDFSRSFVGRLFYVVNYFFKF